VPLKGQSTPWQDRFWAKVMPEPNSGCWLWTAGVDKDGYGVFTKYDDDPAETGYAQRAHRIVWKLNCGPIASNQQVLHKCDLTCCVNPDHLFLGTTQDNTADRHRKGRSARGECDGNVKLTAADVRAIRASTWNQGDLAFAYSVSQQTISNIILGKTWRHVA